VAGSTRGTSPVPDTRPSLSTRWRRWRLQSCCLSEREDRRTSAMGRLFDRCCRYDLIITDARLGTQGWPGGLARDQSSRSWLASSLPAFFEALRLFLSRRHARRAAVAQTSPACAYCRRRPRRPHPRRLQESHQFGQESRAALLLSLACGTHCSVRGCNLVTPRLSAAAHAAAATGSRQAAAVSVTVTSRAVALVEGFMRMAATMITAIAIRTTTRTAVTGIRPL
jgi:hypothetical protein